LLRTFGRDGPSITFWNFALTTRFDNHVEGKRDSALETLSSYRGRCDLAICGKGDKSRISDQAKMGKRKQSFSAPRSARVWLVQFNWYSPQMFTSVGRMWTMINYNLFILSALGW
jgi:hypothetical protein